MTQTTLPSTVFGQKYDISKHADQCSEEVLKVGH